jgi:hypothetical protein
VQTGGARCVWREGGGERGGGPPGEPTGAWHAARNEERVPTRPGRSEDVVAPSATQLAAPSHADKQKNQTQTRGGGPDFRGEVAETRKEHGIDPYATHGARVCVCVFVFVFVFVLCEYMALAKRTAHTGRKASWRKEGSRLRRKWTREAQETTHTHTHTYVCIIHTYIRTYMQIYIHA